MLQPTDHFRHVALARTPRDERATQADAGPHRATLGPYLATHHYRLGKRCRRHPGGLLTALCRADVLPAQKTASVAFAVRRVDGIDRGFPAALADDPV
jgi:hypothetical protein